jgi:hypothetical protein
MALINYKGRPCIVKYTYITKTPIPPVLQFERAATVGVGVVVVLMALVVGRALALGLPAISDGELPLWWGGTSSLSSLPEGFAGGLPLALAWQVGCCRLSVLGSAFLSSLPEGFAGGLLWALAWPLGCRRLQLGK